jgi:hypothetical protein
MLFVPSISVPKLDLSTMFTVSTWTSSLLPAPTLLSLLLLFLLLLVARTLGRISHRKYSHPLSGLPTASILAPLTDWWAIWHIAVAHDRAFVLDSALRKEGNGKVVRFGPAQVVTSDLRAVRSVLQSRLDMVSG